MKDIKGYDGLYAVTEDGKVWSYCRKIYLTPNIDKNGYHRVCVIKNGKKATITIHRLVAEAYISNPENLPDVNHKDENKSNNTINNLEWCNEAYNNCYGTRINRIRKPIICEELNKVYDSAIAASEETRIDKSSITKCCKGKRETAGGYHWRYADELLGEKDT